MTPTGAIQRATSYGTTDAGFNSRRCECYFYLGLRARLTGKPARAQDYFERALVRGDATMPEWHAARRMARR